MMNLSRGMIKLSYRQAESSPGNAAALCLKYIIAGGVAAAAFVLWLRNRDSGESAVSLGCSAVAALTAVYFRTSFVQRMYEITAQYLHTERESFSIKPNFAQICGFGTALLAVKCLIWFLLLLPAAFCLHIGMVSYSLSGEREQLLLMLNAALCLAAGGSLFAAIILARFGCAEYLFFSGQCGSVFAALDDSWLITRGEGDQMLLMMNGLPRLCGLRLSALCRLNMAEKLTRDYFDKHVPSEFSITLRRDSLGEQRLELIPIRE